MKLQLQKHVGNLELKIDAALSILDEFPIHSKELRNLRSLMSQNNSLAQVLHTFPTTKYLYLS